jgi:subtilase family serine protease
VTSLLNAGYNGAGQTIIIDSFGSPTIAADLHQFDLAFGLLTRLRSPCLPL